MDVVQSNGHLHCPTHDMIYCVLEFPATVMEDWRGGEGREGGREGGRKGGRERGRERGWEGGGEGEGGREGGRERGREGRREGGREGGRERGWEGGGEGGRVNEKLAERCVGREGEKEVRGIVGRKEKMRENNTACIIRETSNKLTHM